MIIVQRPIVPPQPSTVEADALAAALTRFIGTATCPRYVRTAAQAWLATRKST